MNESNRTVLGNTDKWIVFIYLILVSFGLMNIYSVAPDKAEKQLIWFLLGIIFIIIVYQYNPNDYKYFSFLLYIISIILLIAVLIFGKSINGAKAWFDLNFIKFQPSELSKITTSLVIAKLMNKHNFSIMKENMLLKISIIIGIPIILILLQPDPGSALIFLSFVLVFYREGLPIKFIIFSLFLIFMFLLAINISFNILLFSIVMIYILYILFFINIKNNNILYYISILLFIISYTFISPILFEKLLKPHHKNRILILFKNEFDIKYRDNVGYNLFSAKSAIASGRFFGKGFKQGTITKGKFVPEQFTDYIFCTVGEEWGFQGGVILIIIYLIFIARIYYLSEYQKDKFIRIFGYSVGSIFFFHLFINLGMVMGIVPTIGIPLPFFSYGGSSLWAFTILLFLFLRLNAYDRNSLF